MGNIMNKIRGIYIYINNLFYRLKNFYKPKILFYSDSRGQNVMAMNKNKIERDFYTAKLKNKYNIDLYICPEKHTSMMDFIKLYLMNKKKYDLIIAYVGIVDFSPRHQKIAVSQIYELKMDIYDKIFGKETMTNHLTKDFGLDYEGDKTINMFSLEMAEMYLIPFLNSIPNLIWIGCNNFVRGWEGNYFKKRPDNIYVIEEYSKLFCKKLNNVIDLSNWNEEEIKCYTCDNIHLTKLGSENIFEQITKKLIVLSNK